MVFDNTALESVTVTYNGLPYTAFLSGTTYTVSVPRATVPTFDVTVETEVNDAAVGIDGATAADGTAARSGTVTGVLAAGLNSFSNLIRVEAGTGYFTEYTLVITAYGIGDTGPAGGKIFYIDDGTYGGGTWTYLEAAPADCVGPETGGTANVGLTNDDFYTNGTGTDIGTGKANTQFMLSCGVADGTATRLCDAYTYGGFDDWFLPSLDELEEMYNNILGTGGFTTDDYWSSSLYAVNYGWKWDFNTGIVAAGYIYYPCYVRAVRAF
jgi:hypothetical protein